MRRTISLIILTLILVHVSCGLPSTGITSLNTPRLIRSGDTYRIDIPESSQGSTGITIQYRILVYSNAEEAEEEFTTDRNAISAERTGLLAFQEASSQGYRVLRSSVTDRITVDFGSYESFFTEEALSTGIVSNASNESLTLNYDRTELDPMLILTITGSSREIASLALRRDNNGELKNFSPRISTNYELSDADIEHVDDGVIPNIRSQNIRVSLIVYMFREREGFGSDDVYSLPAILSWENLLVINEL